MSAGHLSQRQSKSSRSQGSDRNIADSALTEHPPPGDPGLAFETCAATASYFLYAEQNVIICLHHDTLAIERRFDKHREDVLLIAADNVSEKGAGRQVVSYDAGQTAIVWDLATGDEIARFASYEPIKVASWMRNGIVAFGNVQGNVILFEPSTSEHTSSRTIFDPITTLAPAADCRTFAIGYMNGSILIAILQPSFTILNSLTTSRGPSPITGLAWHGSSSKQKSEMLATQTSDGDLRVWSVSKYPHNEQPRNIRILGDHDSGPGGKTWFSWSKNGRIVQHSEGETRIWDVRTKKVSCITVPTIDNVVAIANHATTASLFTLGHNHTVQQYDLNPMGSPAMVASIQHVPANAPPTPPDSVEPQIRLDHGFGSTPSATPDPPMVTPSPFDASVESSEDESAMMSPLQKIAHEMDQLEEERRDRLGPLSPISSRASMSSASSYGRRMRHRPRDRNVYSTRGSEPSDGTTFSIDSPCSTPGFDNMSIRSGSMVSSLRANSSLRFETPRSPDDRRLRQMDLFPFTTSRLRKVQFRTPMYDPSKINVDVLRQEMLKCVFGWDGDIEGLVRDEQSRQRVGSSSSVLLSKWLGDDGSDHLAQMIGSESMSSSDWMFLALSGHMGVGQQQVGRAFVTRLLQTQEIHPAVAILLGLGELNEAIEVYVSRGFYMEAVLLTCLMFPSDWRRIAQLVRKWAEKAVSQNQAELAARCFSCTGFQEGQVQGERSSQAPRQAPNFDSMSPPNSPPSATTNSSSRLKEKNASLKLITDFGTKGPVPLQAALGLTPIVDSAVEPSPGGHGIRSKSKGKRDPSSARTATPTNFRRARDGSMGRTPITATGPESTPLPTRGTTPLSEITVAEPSTAIKDYASNKSDALPSPAAHAFSSRRDRSKSREARNPHNLQLDVVQTVEKDDLTSPAPMSGSTRSKHRRSASSVDKYAKPKKADLDQNQLDTNSRASKMRIIDKYIDSLEEANYQAQNQNTESISRPGSRTRSRRRSGSQAGSDVHYIKPAKRSPSSPTAMTTDTSQKQKSEEGTEEDSYSGIKSPGAYSNRGVTTSETISRTELGAGKRATSKPSSRAQSPDRFLTSKSYERTGVSPARSPRSPSVDGSQARRGPSRETVGDRARARSSSRKAVESRRPLSPDRTSRARSSSRRPALSHRDTFESADELVEPIMSPIARASTADGFKMSRKAIAQRELEERRLSLARRPSVPTIPHPGQLASPTAVPQLFNDQPDVPRRSQTADIENSRNLGRLVTSTTSVSMGLPATPRAMKHPKYMGDSNDGDDVPAVPPVPSHFTSVLTDAEKYENDELGLLPSSTYIPRSLPRSMSAPPEQHEGNRSSHRRKTSQVKQPSRTSQADEEILILDNSEYLEDYMPPVLAELQHLVEPPPPPPPPPPPQSRHLQNGSDHYNSSGVISITIPTTTGVSAASASTDRSTDRSGVTDRSATTDRSGISEHSTTSSISNTQRPKFERRGSDISVNTNISAPISVSAAGVGTTTNVGNSSNNSSKWRQVTDRLRSNSKQRTRSTSTHVETSPYETILPSTTFGGAEHSLRTRNASEDRGIMGVAMSNMPPPLPSTTYDPNQGITNHGKNVSVGNGGYRNPKEIRANMPPEDLQPGVYMPRGVQGGVF